MPFGVTAAVTSGLVAAGVGEATAGILAAGLVDAGAGAAIGGGISALTGGNVGHGATMGALGGAVAGGGGAALEDLAPETAASLGLGTDAASTASGTTPANAASIAGTPSAAGTAGATGSTASPLSGVSSDFSNGIINPSSQLSDGYIPSAPGIDSLGVQGGFSPSATGAAAAPASSSMLGNVGNWASKNPLQAAVLGNIGLTSIQALMPKPQVNVGQNAANTLATNPSFNAALPQYTMKNTATPYTGNWYTYGETPQPVMYNAQPVLQQAQGGLVNGYAKGGRVNYAAGGPVAPQVNPLAAMGSMPPNAPMPQNNPLATENGFNIGKAIGQHLQNSGALKNVSSPQDAYKVGHAIGKHLKTPTFTGDGQVSGPGKGQDDAIPAKLSQDEYVIPADIVSHLGDGSSNAGGKVLDHMVHQVRAQKAKSGSGFPPKAHNPLSYLPKKEKS